MDSLDSSSLGLIPLVSGQKLEPNKRYFADRNCDSFSLPSRRELKAGDCFVIHRTLEPKDIIVNFPDGLLFSTSPRFYNQTIIEGVSELYYKWPASIDYRIGFTILKLYFNGLDFQTEETSGSLSGQAIRNNEKTYTASGSFTVPSGVSQLKVTVVGGGGGGGGGATSIHTQNSHCAQSGSGGGGGAAVIDAYIPVSSGQVISVQVGAGGSRGGSGQEYSDNNGKTNAVSLGTNGGSGGTSSFGNYITCTGGAGGIRGDVTQSDNRRLPALSGGDGGLVTAGLDLGLPFSGGKGGASGAASSDEIHATSGEDGESVNGFLGGKGELFPPTGRDGGAGGGGASAKATGGNASSFTGGSFGGGGAGGSGSSFYSGTGGGRSGGAGASGVVIVEWSL